MSQKEHQPVCITGFSGPAVAVRGNDIDTDRIIPARFMKCVTFEGLGRYAFYDERFDSEGSPKGHSFDNPRWAGHPVLVGNANFGCGSSREHAPQALKDYGIRAIVAESFAEIFAGNCCSLGMPALTLTSADVQALQEEVESRPGNTVSIDLEAMTVQCGGHTWKTQMPSAYRRSLLNGSWDSTSVLAAAGKAIDRTAAELPYI